MDAFFLRNRLIDDYRGYVEGFLSIADERIRDTVNSAFVKGTLWPEPLIQLNPTFSSGGTIDELVNSGTLHSECSRIFRIGKSPDTPLGRPMRLHRHQGDALEAAKAGDNYVLTTGTGSGKSLAYILPIVDHILRVGSGRRPQAIIVYPMNALANSQLGELQKYLDKATFGDTPPVTIQRYTGQEKQHERDAILDKPPDILLTNYVMLDLMLTRPHECKRLFTDAQSMRFIVLDELHTYRGRQGADIALLLRRLANIIPAEKLQYIGTSATMSTEGTFNEQRQVIADVASRLFGEEVKPQRIIGETLERAMMERSPESLRKELMEIFRNGDNPIWPDRYDDFVKHPLAIWLENMLGLRGDATGRLVRQIPKAIGGENGLAALLETETGEPFERCANVIHDMLLAGTKCASSPITEKKPFTFRVHQFFSRGDTAYATLGGLKERFITLQGQQFYPCDGPARRLYPLSFCRECGQEFYGVLKDTEKGIWLPRPFDRRPEDDNDEAGYLFLAEGSTWPDDPQAILERVPDDWLESHRGGLRVKRNREHCLPQIRSIGLDGATDANGVAAYYIPFPFRLCPNCGVSYSGRTGEASKLATLGTGGRSTATTILALATLREMHDAGIADSERKLLDFTDNRQDASLQAGHFNDFVETTLLRSALCRALSMAGSAGLRHDQLSLTVFSALAMPKERYLSNSEVRYEALERANQAFRDLLAYRLYVDLRRGWRITAPNLEQIDLLRFEYPSLKELCYCDSDWQRQKGEKRERVPAWQQASPEMRHKAATILLDHLRRELAIKVMALDPAHHEILRSNAWNMLCDPWRFEDGENLAYASIAWARPRGRGRFDRGGDVYLSPRSGFGQCLKRLLTKESIPFDHPQEIVEDMLRSLSIAGLVECVRSPVNDDAGGWQLNASAMVWKAGTGERPYHDPVRVPQPSAIGTRPHRFFIDLYRENTAGLETLYAREHTAQVVQEVRQDREKDFREGKLPVLFCSPTMELGVDIATLNVVGMRNVPPTPANYAQRSGRAGRSGQAALVFTYCSGGSAHDQYYFRRNEKMVAGVVQPPRLDLANEDLVRSHVHAIWLSESGESLGTGLHDLLDLSKPNAERPSPTPRILAAFTSQHNMHKALVRAQSALKGIEGELQRSGWYSNDWLERTLAAIPLAFEEACVRWWRLYTDAYHQANRQNAITLDTSRSAQDKSDAKRLWNEAQTQLRLLTQEDDYRQNDFSSYRYFASEGFLPGYSFPRLPLSAYIPGRNLRGQEGDYLSRPRFLAISEFGPRAHIYHEGGRYEVTKVALGISADGLLQTRTVKHCPNCGYLHPVAPGEILERCQSCGHSLGAALSNLFQMRNVTVRRRDRITSDEEERLRMGYELRTAVHFADRDGGGVRSAEIITPEGDLWGHLQYGMAATLWRMNLGWRRRTPGSPPGFFLDIQKGAWEKRPQGDDEGDSDSSSDSDDPQKERSRQVIPYVEDRRNILMLTPANPPDRAVMATLQSALRSAMLINFQLEDGELAAEALPDADHRNRLLFYESAEGGAGVLRQLIDDAAVWPALLQQALSLCHYDPNTGRDCMHPVGATENCIAACYGCLLNYGNQNDHAIIDRRLIVDLLMMLSQSRIDASPVLPTRAEHLDSLKRLAGSDLERRWLDWLDEGRGRLPDKSQVLLEEFRTKPDFLYTGMSGAGSPAAIYVDGPPHDFPERQARDVAMTDVLEDAGYIVVRFHHEADWDAIRDANPGIFGNRT